MSTVNMKDKFSDSGLKLFEKALIGNTFGVYQIATVKFAVNHATQTSVVKVNIVHIADDFDLEVVHNLYNKTIKPNNTSSVLSFTASRNMKKSPLIGFDPYSTLQYTLANPVAIEEHFSPTGGGCYRRDSFKQSRCDLLHQGVYYDRDAPCGIVATVLSPSAIKG